LSKIPLAVRGSAEFEFTCIQIHPALQAAGCESLQLASKRVHTMANASTVTMLFADLMNPSSKMTKSLTLQEYDEMIADFQNTLSLVTSTHLKNFNYVGDGTDSEWSIAGDELRIFLYSGDLRFDVRNALILAVKLKLGWLTSVFNQKIFMEGRPVSRISVGINCGRVIKEVQQGQMSLGHGQYQIERKDIRLAKRIESIAREGTVYQVMMSEASYQVCNEDHQLNVAFSRLPREVPEDQKKKPPVYEVVSFINYEIVPTMPESIKDRVTEAMEYTVVKPMPEPWIYFILLRCYISRILAGEQEEVASKAIKLANHALGVLKNRKTLYNILGWLHTYCDSLMDLDRGLQYFEKALELEPLDQAALLHRARISEERGNREIARHSYQEILRHNPEHPEAKRKLAHDKNMNRDRKVGN
jgi:tetratricopeptide (TPR) repeat protein